jgi:hypothetical protein
MKSFKAYLAEAQKGADTYSTKTKKNIKAVEKHLKENKIKYTTEEGYNAQWFYLKDEGKALYVYEKIDLYPLLKDGRKGRKIDTGLDAKNLLLIEEVNDMVTQYSTKTKMNIAAITKFLKINKIEHRIERDKTGEWFFIKDKVIHAEDNIAIYDMDGNKKGRKIATLPSIAGLMKELK